MPITTEAILADLAELLAARGPCGYEDEVAAVLTRRLEEFCDEVRTDPSGNVIGLIRGQSREPGIKVMAHKDEISLYVKRILPDGKLTVGPMGGMTYRRFGGRFWLSCNDTREICASSLKSGTSAKWSPMCASGTSESVSIGTAPMNCMTT